MMYPGGFMQPPNWGAQMPMPWPSAGAGVSPAAAATTTSAPAAAPGPRKPLLRNRSRYSRFVRELADLRSELADFCAREYCVATGRVATRGGGGIPPRESLDATAVRAFVWDTLRRYDARGSGFIRRPELNSALGSMHIFLSPHEQALLRSAFRRRVSDGVDDTGSKRHAELDIARVATFLGGSEEEASAELDCIEEETQRRLRADKKKPPTSRPRRHQRTLPAPGEDETETDATNGTNVPAPFVTMETEKAEARLQEVLDDDTLPNAPDSLAHWLHSVASPLESRNAMRLLAMLQQFEESTGLSQRDSSLTEHLLQTSLSSEGRHRVNDAATWSPETLSRWRPRQVGGGEGGSMPPLPEAADGGGDLVWLPLGTKLRVGIRFELEES